MAQTVFSYCNYVIYKQLETRFPRHIAEKLLDFNKRFCPGVGHFTEQYGPGRLHLGNLPGGGHFTTK